MTNPLRAVLQSGRPAIGSWCATPSSFVVEVLTVEPVDFVVLDGQHGLVELAHLAGLLAAVPVGVAPLVRVASDDAAAIAKVLDLGAAGVIVPYIESAASASHVVSACRYPPRGRRSYGPTRIGLSIGADPAVVEAHPLCFVMIETPQGVEHADEICAVDGIDGIYVGPADLAIGLGLSPASAATSASHAHAIETVRQACVRAGRFAGIHTTGGGEAATRFAAGFHLCSLPTDAVLLRRALHHELDLARSSPANPAG
jgi:4-hydroxy-2-oxoheptanedioate aldolase